MYEYTAPLPAGDADAAGVPPYASLDVFSYDGMLAAFELGTIVGWASAATTAGLVR